MPGALLLAAALAAVPSAAPPAPAPEALHAAWPGVRLSPPSGSYAPEALRADLEALAGSSRGVVRIAEKGRSTEGREIAVVLAGSGPEKVLLWSQMHGDEPTATAALVDLLAFLAENGAEPATAHLLTRLTLVVVPMLNPDGAVRGDRRNAQGIDINRDASRLQSPEGRFLKELRDRYAPSAGFNLHNQSPLVTAGPGGPQVAIAVLAVSASRNEPDGPSLARKRGLAGHLARVASTFVPGRVTRYANDYTERAFGDSMSRWGTPTVLLETG
ncbi:MAG TPA: M14 family zinc carboxypeptidase, partial [Thermoanaerobaculia bacterium]|nr:M14 family zinc carboxypeptidase [Thermoanaerobaculia bacterium]